MMKASFLPRMLALACCAVIALFGFTACAHEMCGGENKMTEFTYFMIKDSTSARDISLLLNNTPLTIAYQNNEGFLSPVSVSVSADKQMYTVNLVEITRSTGVQSFIVNGGGKTLGTLKIDGVTKRNNQTVSLSFNNSPLTLMGSSRYYELVMRD